MTLHETLKSISSEIGIQMQYANLNEANFGLNEVKDFPCIILLPYEQTDTVGVSSLIQTAVPLTMFFMDIKREASTLDYKTVEVEDIVDNMRKRARQFMFKLRASPIIDTTAGYKPATLLPTYSQFDANAHGVMVNVTIDIVEGITGCV